MPSRRPETLYKIKHRTERRCSVCGIVKKISEFNKDKYCPDWLYPVCKSCRKIKTRKRYSNPDVKRKISEWWKKYRQTEKWKIAKINNRNKRRLAKSLYVVKTKDIMNLLKYQKYKCAICKKSIKKKKHLDHILPLAKGWKHIIYNLQWLCPECNLKKWDRIECTIWLFN